MKEGIVAEKELKEGKYLMLWTTLYPNETIAKNETEKMVEGMRKCGGSWASNLKEVTIVNKKIQSPG